MHIYQTNDTFRTVPIFMATVLSRDMSHTFHICLILITFFLSEGKISRFSCVADGGEMWESVKRPFP